MKKVFARLFGFWVFILLMGCSDQSTSQQQCDIFRSLIQEEMNSSHPNSGDIKWLKILQSDVFYSLNNGSCYKWQISEFDNDRRYRIDKIIPWKTGYKISNPIDDSYPTFIASCVLDRDIFIHIVGQWLTGDKVESELCMYKATHCLKSYQEEMSKLIWN